MNDTTVEGPANERDTPLARVSRAGPKALEDYELLALAGLPIGKRRLDTAGGLRGIFDNPSRACRAGHLSREESSAAQALLEVHARWIETRLHLGARQKTTSAEIRRYLTARLRGYRYEVFGMLFLDLHDRVLSFDEMFRGTIDGASVHPREIVCRALELNASKAIACHNHPAGIADGSRADRAITMNLRDALQLVDVRLLDHLVIGDGEVCSFAEEGWL